MITVSHVMSINSWLNKFLKTSLKSLRKSVKVKIHSLTEFGKVYTGTMNLNMGILLQ